MARKTLLALASLAAVAAPLAAATPAPAPAQYDVRLVVRDGDAPPSTPRLLVNAGRPARFVVANERYNLSVTATPDHAGRVSVDSHISTWSPGGLHTDASTVTIDAHGAPSTILSPHAEPGTGAPTRMRIEVSARPVGD